MGKATGFIEIARLKPPARPVVERVRDWNEVYLPQAVPPLRDQGARCMDCSVPFCHQGCPLGNLVPDWNDLVYRDRWRPAFERLMATNNFPEFTGRLCPAPCEGSCVLGINDDPVTIKSIELAIVERAFEEGWIAPRPPARRTGKRVADRRIRPGRPGGGRRSESGGPFGHRLRARRPDRRAAALRDSRVQDGEARSSTGGCRSWNRKGSSSAPASTSASMLPVSELRQEFDAIVLAGGASDARDLDVPGRELRGHSFRHGVPDAAEPPLRRRRHRGGSASSRPKASAS